MMRSRVRRRLLVSLLLVPCLGFEWPGQVHRIQHEIEHGDPAQRRELVRKLAQYPASSAKDALLLALEDNDPEVRLEAADVAGRVRLREAVPILLDWIDDKEAQTRKSAAVALGRIGEARALPALLRALGDSGDEVRRAAVGALAQLGAEDAVVPLLGKLDDGDNAVRTDAIVALARLGDARAVVPLLGAAADPAAEVRSAALATLGQIGDARALPALTRALGDDVEEVHIEAAAALGRIGDAGAVRALKAALERAEPRFAQAIVAALGNIDDDAARAVLISVLAAPALGDAAQRALVWQARKRAWNFPSTGVAAPGTTAAPAATLTRFAALVQSLGDALRNAPDAAPRGAIADTLAELAQLGPIDAAVPSLLATLSSAEGELARAVMRALGASASPEALLPLLERLGKSAPAALAPVLQALLLYFERAEPDGRAADPLLDRLPEVPEAARLSVVTLLGRVRAPRALPTLIGLFSHSDVSLRLAAVRAVGAIGAREGAPALVPLLDDPDARMRFAAADALGTSANAELARSLVARLKRDATADRHALIVALGAALARLARAQQLPAPDAKEALAVLASFLQADDDELADRAADALAVWAPKGALEPLAAGLRLPSSRRRASAVRALGQLDEPGTRQVLRYVLKNGTAREAAAAAAALGDVGDPRDVVALVKLIKRLHWPAPGAASYALGRIAQRGAWKPHLAARTLCELGQSREPYVRANVAAALGALAAGSCEDGGPDPVRWLEPEHAAIVRAAAARWLYAGASAGRIDAGRATRALESCLTKDTDPAVRAACAAPAPVQKRDATDVYAYASDGVTLMRNTLVGLRLEDGAAFLGYTDQNGQLRLKSAPIGKIEIEDPTLSALEPAAL